jgi:hypothetical protein
MLSILDIRALANDKVKWERLKKDMPKLKKETMSLASIQALEARVIEENCQMALMDEASLRDWVETAETRGFERGIELGLQKVNEKNIKKGIIGIARKLLAEDIQLIVRATGRSETEIEKL